MGLEVFYRAEQEAFGVDDSIFRSVPLQSQKL